MTVTEKAFADLLLNHLTTIEPVARNVTLKNDVKKVAQPDGSTKIQMVPTKGDAYLPRELGVVLAKAIAKTIFAQLFSYVKDPMVSKINELIDQYNQLRSDYISGGGSTTAHHVDKIS